MKEIKTHQSDVSEVYAGCHREFLYKEMQYLSLLCPEGD